MNVMLTAKGGGLFTVWFNGVQLEQSHTAEREAAQTVTNLKRQHPFSEVWYEYPATKVVAEIVEAPQDFEGVGEFTVLASEGAELVRVEGTVKVHVLGDGKAVLDLVRIR